MIKREPLSREFQLNAGHGPRKGTCYYAAKFKYFHGQQVPPEFQNYFEITRDQPDSLGKDALRKLFQSSELLVCFENTALAIEAMLCGCPVAFFPNEFCDRVIADDELGPYGVSWGMDAPNIEHAKATVRKFRAQYLSVIERIPASLDHLISATQEAAERTAFRKPVNESMLVSIVGYEIRFLHKISTQIARLSRRMLVARGMTFRHLLISIFKFALKQLGLFPLAKKGFLLARDNWRRIKGTRLAVGRRLPLNNLRADQLPPHIIE